MKLLSWRNLLKLALYFLVVTLPVAFYLRTYDSAMLKTTILQLGTLFAVTIWLLGSILEERFEFPEKVVPFILPALLLFLWNAIRFSVSSYRCAALTGFIMQEALLAVFVLTCLTFSRRNLLQAFLVMMGGWLITVLYGLAQHFSLDPFAWKGAFGRPIFSTLANPNLFAAYLLLCLPSALAFASDNRLSRWIRALAAVGSVLSAFTLAWTRTHFEIAVFVVEIAIFMVLTARILRGGRRSITLGLAGLCVAVCIGIGIADRSLFMGQDWLKKKTFTVETWKGTMELIKSHPWSGTGPGSFLVYYPAFRRSSVILNEHRHNTETDHPENEFLEQWAEGGIPGVLLWLWLFTAVLYKSWKRLSDPGAEREDLLYAAGCYAGLLLSFISMYTRFPAPGGVLVFMAGLMCAAHRSGSEDSEMLFVVPLPFGALRYVLIVPILIGVSWLGWSSIRIFNSDSDINMAIYYSKMGQWEQALTIYDKMPWGYSLYTRSQYFKGNVLNDRNAPGDAEKAVAQYHHVRSLAPDYVQVHYQEALALRKLGRKEEAVERLEAQVRLDPVWDAPWKMLAELYRETGEPGKSAAAAQKEVEAKKLWEQADQTRLK